MNDAPHTGDDRVPPGQYVTDKWPVLTYGRTPQVEREKWTFRLSGLVDEEKTLSWRDLQALPRTRITADFHCVTRFSTLDNGWEGFSTRDLLRAVRIHPEASHVMIHCYGGYTTNLPLEDFLSEHALFADTHNGKPLLLDHGGPLRLVVPHLYAWKSAKWANGVELLSKTSAASGRRTATTPTAIPGWRSASARRRPLRPTRCGGGRRSWGSFPTD